MEQKLPEMPAVLGIWLLVDDRLIGRQGAAGNGSRLPGGGQDPHDEPNLRCAVRARSGSIHQAAEKLASWDLSGAVTDLAGVLGTATGGLLAGVFAKGTANTVLRGIAKNATLREYARRVGT